MNNILHGVNYIYVPLNPEVPLLSFWFSYYFRMYLYIMNTLLTELPFSYVIYEGNIPWCRKNLQ